MKKILILIAVVALGAFAWWTISPLFIDKVVEDELDPEIAALIETNTLAVPATESVNSPPIEAVDLPTENNNDESTKISLPTESVSVPATSSPSLASGSPVIRGPFTIVDTPGHPATGNIRIIETAEQTLVRYENYDGTNGPDLKVYLTNDLEDVSDFVSLGAARGNQGNINYEVPDGVDIDDFQYVVTWCEAFGVLFDYAEIK